MGSGRIQNSRPGHVSLRRFEPADGDATHRVFYTAIHEGAKAHYSAPERAAWAMHREAPPNWRTHLASMFTILAINEGRVLGFMSLTDAGYIDMAYVAPHVMGTGVAARLYAEIEARAQTLGLTRLTVEASHLAKSFFLKQGWTQIAAQQLVRSGHKIANFRMEKAL